MFRLSKWYLDLVTDEGAVLILYAARLRWGPVGVDYASVLHTTGGAPIRDARSWRRAEQPQLDGDVLAWRNDPLQVRGQWQRDAAPIDCTLIDGPSGAIRWTCHMPRARAVVHCGDDEFAGLGYAESLSMTIPPTRLPFRTLRWGRHLSQRHALVWIDWDGAPDTRWIWLDGVAARDTSSPEGLHYGLVRLWDPREVRDRRVFGLHEHKQVSRSAIVVAGHPADEGWAIHEVVTTPRSRDRGPRSESGGM